MRGRMKLTYDDLAAGSDVHIARELDARTIEIAARSDMAEEFDALIAHIYEDMTRGFAMFPKMGANGFYASAEIMRTS